MILSLSVVRQLSQIRQMLKTFCRGYCQPSNHHINKLPIWKLSWGQPKKGQPSNMENHQKDNHQKGNHHMDNHQKENRFTLHLSFLVSSRQLPLHMSAALHRCSFSRCPQWPSWNTFIKIVFWEPCCICADKHNRCFFGCSLYLSVKLWAWLKTGLAVEASRIGRCKMVLLDVDFDQKLCGILLPILCFK